MKYFLPFLFSVSLFAANHIVLFKQQEVAVGSLSHGDFQNLLQSTNAKSVNQLKEWIGSRGYRADVQDLWLIRGAVVNIEEETAKKLAKEPWVHFVRRDKSRQYLHPIPTSNVGNSLSDINGDLWGLKRLGIDKIRAEFPKIDGTGIRVGVLDTGIQGKHAELAGKTTHFKDVVNNLPGPYDDQGHGTHVSGTIAGNQVGVAPGAKIIFGKMLSASGSGDDSSILAAMQWAFDPDGNPATADFPHIISNSWGGNLPNGVNDIAEVAPFQLAITAWIHGGIVPVFAAGNSGTTPNGIPGGLPEPIAVGALAPNDDIAEFSSRGPNLWKIGETILTVMKPDITAPGVKTPSAYPGNKYAVMDGTSMATPHVAGALALLLQTNPKLKFADVKKLLLQTCEKKMDNKFGMGVLNAYELVKAGIASRQ